jgi:hypothetical protein
VIFVWGLCFALRFEILDRVEILKTKKINQPVIAVVPVTTIDCHRSRRRWNSCLPATSRYTWGLQTLEIDILLTGFNTHELGRLAQWQGA